MRVDELKNKILQLAIQGKLVEQNANDTPASVLLEGIKAEKERLVKEKAIKKEKPLPEITDEEKIVVLPNGWEWCRLGEIGIYKKGPFGSSITKSIFVPKSEQAIKVYEQKNAIKKDCTLGDYYISKEYFEEKLKGFEVFEGDIIVSCAGTIGETYIMPKGIEKGVINQALMRMKIFDCIDVNYFLLYFDFILKNTAKESSKGSAIKNIPPFDIFKKMLFQLPPLEEQKRIVAKVNELFVLIDELNENKENMLKTISGTRNKVLQLAIQGKLVEQCNDDIPAKELFKQIKVEKEKLISEKVIKKEKKLPEITDEEKIFEIPKGWEWCRLGDVVQINPRNKADDETEVSFVPMSLVSDGYDSNHDFEVRTWKEVKSGFTHFAENDVVVAKITPCFENRKSAIMKNLKNSIGAGTTELYVFRPYNGLVLPEFIFNLMITKEFIEGGKATYTGTAGQQRVKKEFVENYVVAIPPLQEQKRIVKKVQTIMAYLNELEKIIKV